jgi:hypothetical protein
MNVPTFYNRRLWNVVENKMSKQKILKEKIILINNFVVLLVFKLKLNELNLV